MNLEERQQLFDAFVSAARRIHGNNVADAILNETSAEYDSVKWFEAKDRAMPVEEPKPHTGPVKWTINRSNCKRDYNGRANR